jgi:nucleoside-diphosphate-sugar epimerase
MPDFSPQSIAVLGASGSIGRGLVAELVRRKIRVRVVSRSADNLKRHFGAAPVERITADLSNPADAARAIDGRDAAICCAGLPLPQFAQHPAIGSALAAAIKQTNVKALLVTSAWSYWPLGDDAGSLAKPLKENATRHPISTLAQHRRAQEDSLADAGAGIAVLPDFFGPGCEHSILNDALRSLLEKRAAFWPADPDMPRDFAFIPDLPRLLADLLAAPGAYGQRWHITGHAPATPRNLIEIAARTLEIEPKIKAPSGFMLSAAALVNKDAKAFKDLLPIYNAPGVLDGSKLRRVMGKYFTTPTQQAIQETLRSLKDQSTT